jgi:two-component system copper resistance phosphate regulon response regulator CusR
MDDHPVILLIEDSSSQAEWFQQLLTQAGYTVQVANDGVEGWCCACHTYPDLILLDINLPTIDGFGVLYLIKRCYITAAIPVIMLTMADKMSDVEYAVALGADGYLFKDDYFCTQDGAHHMIDEVNRLMHRPLMRQAA